MLFPGAKVKVEIVLSIADGRLRFCFGRICFGRIWDLRRGRLEGVLAYPRLVGYPVHFPGFAAVVREGLFEVRCIRVGVRPNKSNKDKFSVQRVLSVKLAAAILKFADLRRE